MTMERRFPIALGSVAILALALRLMLCVSLSDCPSVTSPASVTDMATYLRLSKDVCQGIFPDHFDYQPFYYTVFLPFCRLVSGDSPWGIMLVQSLLGMTAVILTGIAAAEIFRDRYCGLCAAFLLAVSKMHVFYTPFALFELLQSFWMALLLWLAILCHRRNRLHLWAITAFVLGLATLTRGNALLLLPLLIALHLWSTRGNRLRSRLPAILLMLLLFELPQLPFAIRNFSFCGRWTGASTAGEKVLVLGNSPEAPPGGLEYPLTYRRWVENAERKDGRIPVMREIIRWFAREPMMFINLQAEKVLLFWNSREIPNNVSLDNEGRYAPWLCAMLPFGILASLAIFGILANGMHFTTEKSALLAGIIILWLAVSMFYILARFRLCILPYLACFAGFGCLRIFQWIRSHLHERRENLIMLLKAICAVFIVYAAFPLWQENLEPLIAGASRPGGTVVSFPDTTLVYDHAPLLSGGISFVLPESDTVLTKRLLLPDGLRAGKATVRLATMPTSRPAATLTCEGVAYPATFRQDMICAWLEAEIPLPQDARTLTLTWHLQANTPFAIDALRKYGRTENFSYGEAVVELQCMQ